MQTKFYCAIVLHLVYILYTVLVVSLKGIGCFIKKYLLFYYKVIVANQLHDKTVLHETNSLMNYHMLSLCLYADSQVCL